MDILKVIEKFLTKEEYKEDLIKVFEKILPEIESMNEEHIITDADYEEILRLCWTLAGIKVWVDKIVDKCSG